MGNIGRVKPATYARLSYPGKTIAAAATRFKELGAIAPATAALQHVHDAADKAAIVHPLDTPNIRRQARFDPLPLLIAQPKQVPTHDPNPLRIVLSEPKN